MVSAHQLHVVSGYHIGQHRYRTFPLLQKVLLVSVAPEARWLRGATHRKMDQTTQDGVGRNVLIRRKQGMRQRVKEMPEEC